MPFARIWDSSCPRIYAEWESEGASWAIQDLPPEDDEEALQLLVQQMVPDETLCNLSAKMGLPVLEDEESMRSMTEFWRDHLEQRTSLACYVTYSGKKTMAAMNCCIVSCAGETDNAKIEGEGWKNVSEALHIAETAYDIYTYLETNEVLYAMGLVVKRQYRGAKLGAKVLAAREHLCKVLDIKGTATEFTGIASQKCAQKAGFTTLATISMRDLTEAGLKYPLDENKCIKLMVKSFM